MELTSFWKAYLVLAIQVIAHVLCNLKIRYCVQKKPATAVYLYHTSAVQILTASFLWGSLDDIVTCLVHVSSCANMKRALSYWLLMTSLLEILAFRIRLGLCVSHLWVNTTGGWGVRLPVPTLAKRSKIHPHEVPVRIQTTHLKAGRVVSERG